MALLAGRFTIWLAGQGASTVRAAGPVTVGRLDVRGQRQTSPASLGAQARPGVGGVEGHRRRHRPRRAPRRGACRRRRPSGRAPRGSRVAPRPSSATPSSTLPGPDAGRVVEPRLAGPPRRSQHVARGVDAEQHRPDHVVIGRRLTGRRLGRRQGPPRSSRPSAAAGAAYPCGRGSPGRPPGCRRRASAASAARSLPRITFLGWRSSRGSASCGHPASTTADPRRSWRCSCRSRIRRPRRPDPSAAPG